VAVASHTLLTGFERRIFELCDRITTARRIQQVLSKAADVTISEHYVRTVLDDLVARRLVIREHDRFLGLPVLTYNLVEETALPPAQLPRNVAGVYADAA
jgi:hypothetical protein